MTRVRGVRGATTVDENTKEAMLEATSELLAELVRANGIEPDDIAAAMFTTTPDLNAEFPPLAARKMGWEYVPLLSSVEVNVPDGQPRCIRTLLLVNTDIGPRDISNVYLRDAKNLRSRGIGEV